MLKQESVLLFDEVDNLTLSQIRHICFSHFAVRLEQELLEKTNTPDKYGTGMYKQFYDLYGKQITYNTKNISFEQLITTKDSCNLYEFCGNYFGLQPEIRCDGASNGRTTQRTIFTIPEKPHKQEQCEQPVCSQQKDYKTLVNFSKFFGVGEFPFMSIRIVRIGNQDYFMYTISR